LGGVGKEEGVIRGPHVKKIEGIANNPRLMKNLKRNLL